MEDEISADGVTMSHRLFNLLPGVTCLSPCCELVPPELATLKREMSDTTAKRPTLLDYIL